MGDIKISKKMEEKLNMVFVAVLAIFMLILWYLIIPSA